MITCAFELCDKPIAHIVGIKEGKWQYFCSVEHRELCLNPPPEYNAMVKAKLAKLYLPEDLDIKNYDEEVKET